MARAFGLLLVICSLVGTARASEPFGPFRTKAAPVTSDARVATKSTPALPSADPLWFAFRVYQRTLSSQDGARCAHHPTCSLYGVHAVRRHPFLGFFLTVDRMWRAGRSSWLRPMPRAFVHGTQRLYDPLDANDFWLRGISADRQPELLPPRPRQ